MKAFPPLADARLANAVVAAVKDVFEPDADGDHDEDREAPDAPGQ